MKNHMNYERAVKYNTVGKQYIAPWGKIVENSIYLGEGAYMAKNNSGSFLIGKVNPFTGETDSVTLNAKQLGLLGMYTSFLTSQPEPLLQSV